MATVEFRKLVKRYGPLEVVHSIDLMIGDGEFIVLVGPSGCGDGRVGRTGSASSRFRNENEGG